MNDKFIKDVDYYIKDGNLIMTKSYHIKRGQCCGNNCKHCPFNPRYTKGVREIKN